MKTAIWRFNGYYKDLYEINKLTEDNIIKPVLHISCDSKNSLNCPTFRHLDPFAIKPQDCSLQNVQFLSKMQKHLTYFLQMQDRIDYGAFSHETNCLTTSDTIHLFDILCKFFYTQFVKNDVELVLFDEIPHYGEGWLLYIVAREMNIHTLFFCNLPFFGKCLGLKTIEEGENLLRDGKMLAMGKPLDIKNYINPNWFYMPKKTPEHCARNLMVKIYIKFTKYICTFLLRCTVAPFAIKANVRSFSKKMSGLAARLYQTTRFIKNHAKNIVQNPDMETNFVFFALHYQPEATTYPQGKEWGSQLNAIEAVRNIVPQHIPIYIKDHPMSFGSMRGEFFYKRLKNIPNTILVSSKISSAELVKKSTFVATITGTIGFEAIANGKPTVAFGAAWYIGLDGIFAYQRGLKYQDIVNYKIDKDALAEQFAEMSQKFCPFTPYFAYSTNYTKGKIDRVQNTALFVNYMKSFVQKIYDEGVLCVIQARMSSTRLPGKVLIEAVNGVSMLEFMVRRVQQATNIAKIVVATSTDKSDDAIFDECHKIGVACVRGSLFNVLSRFKDASDLYPYKTVARLTADCPLADPSIIDQTIDAFFKSGADYLSYDPDNLVAANGLDCEVFKKVELDRAYQNATLEPELEHVTTYIVNNAKSVQKYDKPVLSNHIRLTLDYKEDYDVIRQIIHELHQGNSNFTIHEILNLHTSKPQIFYPNEKYIQS